MQPLSAFLHQPAPPAPPLPGFPKFAAEALRARFAGFAKDVNGWQVGSAFGGRAFCEGDDLQRAAARLARRPEAG